MKHVIAFIQDHKLTQVIDALHGIEGVSGATASSVRGFGRPHHAEELELPTQGTRLDVFCSDARAEAVIETIRDAAHTGLHGDGKVYVANVEDAVRIETGDRGEQAV